VASIVLACVFLAACDGPPDRTPTLGDADVARGRQLVADKGCVACHSFPDVKWPRGGLGPSLENFGRQGLIAGRLPNQPGPLMQFVPVTGARHGDAGDDDDRPGSPRCHSLSPPAQASLRP
jgi:hypothetical protein